MPIFLQPLVPLFVYGKLGLVTVRKSPVVLTKTGPRNSGVQDTPKNMGKNHESTIKVILYKAPMIFSHS